jgi:hypothetical protein
MILAKKKKPRHRDNGAEAEDKCKSTQVQPSDSQQRHWNEHTPEKKISPSTNASRTIGYSHVDD